MWRERKTSMMKTITSSSFADDIEAKMRSFDKLRIYFENDVTVRKMTKIFSKDGSVTHHYEVYLCYQLCDEVVASPVAL